MLNHQDARSLVSQSLFTSTVGFKGATVATNATCEYKGPVNRQSNMGPAPAKNVQANIYTPQAIPFKSGLSMSMGLNNQIGR